MSRLKYNTKHIRTGRKVSYNLTKKVVSYLPILSYFFMLHRKSCPSQNYKEIFRCNLFGFGQKTARLTENQYKNINEKV